MNKDLEKLLLNLDLTELEIDNLAKESPMIEEISCEEFLKNCNLLVCYGFPADDLDSLLLANPNLFVRSSDVLKKDLINLSNYCDDIEKALKNDPFII